MRKLIVVVVVVAGLWGGYWFLGARAMETALGGWLDARAAEGWVAEYDDLRTAGFPNRFDTTVNGLELADPANGVAWSAPFFQILTLSYRPNHIIAAWPPEQTFATPHERVTLTSDTLRASVVFQPGTALTLDRSSIELAGLRMVSSAGWSGEIPEGRIATRQTPALENAHDVFFEALRVRPSEPIVAALDPAGLLPPVIETLQIDMTLGLDAPLDRFAIERARPAITSVDLREVRARWGDMDLRASGELTVDAQGIPTGSVTVRAENWRQMLEVARTAGVVPEQFLPTVARALEVLAGMSGSPDTLDAPLTFQRGFITFGPFPLGRAPRLVLP